MKRYLLVMMVSLSLLAGSAALAQVLSEKLMFEDGEAGQVYLTNWGVDDVDLPCLKENVKKLCRAIDNHEVPYLKSIIDLNDPEMRAIMASVSVRIERSGRHKNDVYVIVEEPSQYFYVEQGKEIFMAGLLPPGVNFNACWKGQPKE
ncbi:MAG: hypothetical protein AB1896_15345 [Thermodesulfobacteriota bacterium]